MDIGVLNKQAKIKLTTDQWMLVALTVSVFLTVFVQIAAILVISIYALIKRRDMWKRRRPEAILLGCFWILTIVVTVVYGTLPMVLLSAALGLAYVGIVFVSHSMSSHMFNLLSEIICIASWPCFVVALIQMAMGLSWVYGERYCSVFTNANFYGMVCAITILLCVHNFCRTNKWGVRIFYGCTILVNCVAMYMTGSRSSIVVTAVSCAIYLIFTRRWKVLALASAVLVILLSIDILMGETLDLLPRMDEVVSSLNGRFGIWRNAVASITARPIFGYGTYSYARVYNELGGWYALHAHNLLLEMVMDYGIVGLGILLGLFGVILGRSIKANRGLRNKPGLGMVVAAYAIVLLSGMFDLAMLWPQTAALLFFMISYGQEDISAQLTE
ncbi:MAG: O-antigen ligase family protein [Clostridia bacterium]|nr:O-antigen ligase family protein [Clostridia bacterium]